MFDLMQEKGKVKSGQERKKTPNNTKPTVRVRDQTEGEIEKTHMLKNI